MRKIVQLFIITLLILTGRVGVAQTPGTDFTHTASGIHYMITSVSPRTVGVIRPWNNTLYSGVLNIPDTVTYGGNTYRVTALLDSAFYNCSGLTQVTLPTTLTSIGFFVFKGVAPSDSMTLVCQSEVPPTMNENTLYTYYGFSGTSGQTDLNHWRNNVRLQVPCPGFPSYQQSNGWREVVNILGVNTNPHYYDTICAGDGYHLHNYNFDAPTQGVYLSTNPINWGCVYNATLHLVVNPVYRENYYYYYCDGLYNYHSFNNFGFNVGAYGPHVWVDTSISSNGCDSITTLTFNKLEASTSFNDHVCERMEYSFFYNSNLGFHLYDWETHPGDTTIDIQKIFIPVSDGYTVYQGGCSQRVTAHVYINPILRDTTVATVCQGSTYTWNVNGYNQVGGYVSINHLIDSTTFLSDSLYTYNGCYNYQSLDLSVLPLNDTTIYDTICGNDHVVFNGQEYSTPGVYHAVLNNRFGCDSTVTLHLTVLDAYASSSTFNGRVIFQSDFSNSADLNDWSINNGINGWRVRDGALRISQSNSTNSYNLYAFSNSYATYSFNSGVYDSIEISFPYNVNGETGYDYLTIFLNGNSSGAISFTNGTYYTKYLNSNPNTTQILTLYWHNDNSFGMSPAVAINEMSIRGITNQVYNHPVNSIESNICVGDTFHFGIHSYSQSGTFDDTLFTTNGCDSILRVNLHVHQLYNNTINTSFCMGDSILFGNQYYNTTTYATNSFQDHWGCDSVTNLNLTVWPAYDTTLYVTHIGDNPYIFHNHSITQSGTYTDTLPSQHGCDSVVVLILNIFPNAYTLFNDTICNGGTYTLHGFNVSTTGTYVQHLHTVAGSDSTVTLHLMVMPTYNQALYDTICNGETLTFGHHSLTAASSITDSLTTIHSCDSIVTMHLIVHPVFDTVVYDTVIGDSPYLFLGHTLTTSGIYTYTPHSQYGCDSVVHLHLQIYNTATTHIYDTICNTQTYNLHDFNETATGTYYRNLHTIVGNADSTSILHLWVNPIYNDTLEVAICDRTTYTSFGNHLLSTPGFTTDSLHTSRQCDSVMTLHLTVNPVYEVPVFDTLRNDDPYNFYGTNLYQTGLYCDTLPTIHGCDSIIHLALQIYNNAYTSLYDTLCDRDTYQNYGFTLTRAGTYLDSLHTSYGADSVVSMHLWVNPVYEVDVFDTICSNRFLIHHGDTLYTTGSYTDTLSSIHGCDSIITLHLWTLPSYHDTSRVEICDNENYQFHFHEPLTEPGIYHYFMNAHNGCDSIETLFLTVHPIYNDTLYDSILTTENYTFGTHTLYDPGFYTDSLSSQFGCDSVVHLQLSHFYLHTLRLHDTICNGDSLIFNNFVCTRDSIYTDTLTANDNMDSLIVLFLHVNPVYNDTLYDSIFCTQYLIFGNDTISNAGLYTHYLQSIHGCDSVVTLALYQHTTRDFDSTVCMDRMPLIWNGITFPDTLVFEPTLLNDTAIVWNDTAQRNILLAMHVTVTPNPIQTIMDTIVENQLPFNFRGHIYNGNVTADTLLLPAAIGCDTTTYYSLFYHPNVHATADTTICFRQIPFLWNGATFSTHDGVTILTDTTSLISHTGSDSLLTMNVHIPQNSYAVRHDTIMENQLPYSVHGHIYFGPCNLDTITLTNAVGCDSIIYFRLIVMGNTVTQIDSTLCDYLLPLNWNGVNFDDDGTTDLLTDTNILHNIYGADSMIIMRVHILRCTSHVYDSTVCSAMLPLRWNGITFNTPHNMPSILIDSLLYHTSTGADSLIILRLHVNETFNQIFFDTICNNHPYTFLNEEYNASTTLNASLHTIAGCDSNVTVHLTAYPVETSMFEDVICEGIPYYWIDGHTYNEPSLGNMTTLHTMHGCDSIVYLNLLAGEEPNAIISAGATWIPVDNNKVRLEDGTLHGEYRQWVFPDSISTDKVVTYTYPIDYDSVRIWLMATNHDGCSDTTSILLRLDRDFSWAPNAFTPTSENNNRFFIASDGIATIKVAIYNRSGMLMCQYEGLDGFWDGRYHGEVCPQAAYTYIVQYTTIHQPKQILKKVGTVLRLR